MSDPYTTAGDIRRALASITDHYDVALHPPRRGGGSGGRVSKEPPPPVSVDVLDARAATHKDLAYYAQVVLMECRSAEGQEIVTRVDGSNVRALTKFLDTWAEHLTRGNALEAEACARDLTAHASKLRGMALPERRDWISLGTCPLEIDSEGGAIVCAGQVRAHPGRDPQCQKCGTTAVAAWWERVMFPDAETSTLLLEAEIATFVHRAFGGSPIKPSTVRQWVKRGVIAASGRDDKGRSLYSRDAVVYAVARKQEAMG